MTDPEPAQEPVRDWTAEEEDALRQEQERVEKLLREQREKE